MPTVRFRTAWCVVAGIATVTTSLTAACSGARAVESTTAGRGGDTAVVSRKDVVQTVRLHGLVEAVESVPIVTPRLAGAQGGGLVITRLAANGARVKQGDVLVEFDRQEQLNAALEKRAEWQDLEAQIEKKKAEQAQQSAEDETELKLAEHAADMARLETLKNEMLPDIEAEQNTNAFEAAQARYEQLQESLPLKRQAAQAELRMLEVQRDRAREEFRYAEDNAERMIVRSSMAGLVVLKSNWRGGGVTDIEEGDEMWPGRPVMQVVNPVRMRVRVRVNQADLTGLRVGQAAQIALDAFPDHTYTGRLERLAPVGLTSTLNRDIRSYVAVFALDRPDARVAPDLSAAVDVEVARWRQALSVPRSAIRRQGSETYEVAMEDGNGSIDWRPVKLTALTDMEGVIADGVTAGDTVVTSSTEGASP
ncbi:MAG: HlyD family efflux transporter periplasmic adaptor subunit [Luteitalea sp.]|nr:HlyD family efflux transporter periplasmic adaptor subunit [Luteitalea sp.]